jgi:hypothetical protein
MPIPTVRAMARPLRLAVILLLMCAGAVVAAPGITNSNPTPRATIAVPVPKPVRDAFVLQVDQKSGCVWRVSLATGKRALDPLPCQRPKRELKKAERQAADPQVAIAQEPAMVLRNPTLDRRKSR